jgi:hypothetical protein
MQQSGQLIWANFVMAGFWGGAPDCPWGSTRYGLTQGKEMVPELGTGEDSVGRQIRTE